MDTSGIIGLVSAVVSAAVTTLVGIIISRVVNRNLDKRFKKQDELEEYQRNKQKEEHKADIKVIVREELIPVRADIREVKNIQDKLENQLTDIQGGTLSTLKNDILNRYYECDAKGHRTDYDYQAVHASYESYINLGGNSFISDVIDRFDKLPTKEEWVKKQKTKRTKAKKSVEPVEVQI